MEANQNNSLIPHLALPVLPSVIRYYDDFVDEHISLRDLHENVWEIQIAGSRMQLDFINFPTILRDFCKCWCVDILSTLAPATVYMRFRSLTEVPNEDLLAVIDMHPTHAKAVWARILAKGWDNFKLSSIKSIIRYMCKANIGFWSSEYMFLIQQLPLNSVDSYSGVRSGEVFLSIEEEATLVSYFDSISNDALNNPYQINDSELLEASILICSFQFGLRPVQIGRVQLSDVRIWEEEVPSVHLTFKMAKQRTASKSLPMTRKIKREWAPIFVELYRRRQLHSFSPNERLFAVDSAKATAKVIINKTSKLLSRSRCANDFRHTAAQRLVDAGANQEELAEFLGHSDLETGHVYFQTSANQAERVNQALGISKVYQTVSRIAHDRFINLEELAHLKGEQQIAGVPHGISITGIGGCSSGQPACPYNPIMSCYGCRKFMPINDLAIHRNVLVDFRSIVSLFAGSGRDDPNSPAYLQLKRTISCVQSVIHELENSQK